MSPHLPPPDTAAAQPSAETLLVQLSQLHCSGSGQTGIVEHQLDVGIQRAAAGDLLDLGQQEGRGGLALDALLFALGDGLIDGGVDDVGYEVDR